MTGYVAYIVLLLVAFTVSLSDRGCRCLRPEKKVLASGGHSNRRVAEGLMRLAYPDATLREAILGDIQERFAVNHENSGKLAVTRIKLRDYTDIAGSGIWNVVKGVVIGAWRGLASSTATSVSIRR